MKYKKARTCKWRPEWKLDKAGRMHGDWGGTCQWSLLKMGITRVPACLEMSLQKWLIVNGFTCPEQCERCEAYEDDDK